MVDPDRPQFRTLIYKGMRDNQLRFEVEEGDGRRISTDEYLFPIEEMPMEIGVRGLRAELSEARAVGIRIRVTKGFHAASVAVPSLRQ